MTQEDWQRLWRIRDKRDRKKVNQRWVDRWYFKKVLSKEMYDHYEVCHEWGNGARCTLLAPLAHRGALTKGNRKE
jgi:hypothetical protein